MEIIIILYKTLLIIDFMVNTLLELNFEGFFFNDKDAKLILYQKGGVF